MRLGQLVLERYGPFERLKLPLDPAPGRINLIVAPNGYGKSVIRRAIGEFLFRIEDRTPMTFRFGNERMRILADVAHDGGMESLIRRKGHGNTLAYANGAEVPPEFAKHLLGGADEKIFRELFGLDTTLLRSGGKELIRSQGRLGQVLFAAGGGMGRVRELLTELEAKRDELGRATNRHRSRPLWSAMSSWEQAVVDLRRVSLRPDGWTKLEREAADALRNLETLAAEQAAGIAERDRLRTIGATRPWLERLRAATEIVENAADAPELDDTFEQRWRAAVEAGAKSASIAEAAEATLLEAKQARAVLLFEPTWLEAETAIDALAKLRGLAVGAQSDLPKAQAEYADAAAKAARLRQDLGWDAKMVPPPGPEIKDARRRLRLHPDLASDATSTERERAEAANLLSVRQAELDALPDAADVGRIADLAKLLRSGGDPAARLEASRSRLRAAEMELASALAAIPGQPLSEQALSVTATPSEPGLEAVDRTVQGAEAAHTEALHQHASREAEIETERTALAALEQTASLPAPGSLTAARARRDQLWIRICDPSLGTPAPGAAIALDRAIREADDIADALIAHGREVTEAAALRTRIARLEAEFTRSEDRVAETARILNDARSELSAIALAAGGSAQDMAGLRAFLRARAMAVSRLVERNAAAAEFADTEADLRQLGRQLAEAMYLPPPDAAMDLPPPDTASLPTLLAESDRRIATAANLAASREALTRQVREQRVLLTSKAATAAAAAQMLEDWLQRWKPIARMLARREDEAPAATSDVLTLVEELRLTEASREDLERRINAMRTAISLLAAKVAELTGLSPELASLPPIEAAEAFRRRLEHERLEAARCNDADERIKTATKNLASSREAATAATQTLIGLRAALGAATNEAAELQLQRARNASAARKERAEAIRELTVQGGGLSVEVLSVRVLETTAEMDTARIGEIDARQAELTTLITAARDQSIAANSALEQAGSGLEASEAALRREAAQTLLGRTAEEALVLHAARALLQAALDRQSAGADQPLLNRIGAVFRTITDGGHAGVKIEESADGQTMVALDADGISRKLLHQLSEGTSDQLYLALRIAALEDYAAVTSPLPFVVDDVLQTFDDPRTTTTLRALLELSEKVQVIALTHHTHVGRLASTLPADAVHIVQLGG
jgi:uncharacterized protein YhaN